MRPGKTADWEHLCRCELYVQLVREKVLVETALGITKITGLVVADALDHRAEVRSKIGTLAREDIHTYTWQSLLEEAARTWREFLEIVDQRAPDDVRLRDLQVRHDA